MLKILKIFSKITYKQTLNKLKEIYFFIFRLLKKIILKK